MTLTTDAVDISPSLHHTHTNVQQLRVEFVDRPLDQFFTQIVQFHISIIIRTVKHPLFHFQSCDRLTVNSIKTKLVIAPTNPYRTAAISHREMVFIDAEKL